MFKTELVGSRNLAKGDTILTNDCGFLRTISNEDVKYYQNNPSCQIRRVLFAKWFRGKVIRYQTQI